MMGGFSLCSGSGLLQLPTFYFGKRRVTDISSVWTDNSIRYSLNCVCGSGVPGSFEQDCYAAFLCLWIRKGMPIEGISLSYSEIANELGVASKSWKSHIKMSLKRLTEAKYKFTRGIESIRFCLLEFLGEDKSKGVCFFSVPASIAKGLVYEYYTSLDMIWYRSLPEGLTRRFYECLTKHFFLNSCTEFELTEECLQNSLPVFDKHITNRRKRISRICSFLVGAGFLEYYEFDRNKKIYKFRISDRAIGNNDCSKKIQIAERRKSKRVKLEKKKLEILNLLGSKNGSQSFLYRERPFVVVGGYGIQFQDTGTLENWDQLEITGFNLKSEVVSV